MKAKLAVAFLLGTLLGQVLVGSLTAAAQEAWTFSDVRAVIRLLERIETNTRR